MEGGCEGPKEEGCLLKRYIMAGLGRGNVPKVTLVQGGNDRKREIRAFRTGNEEEEKPQMTGRG